MYIADDANCLIRKIAAGTSTITSIAGVGTPGFSGDGGSATAGAIAYPTSVAVDTNGNVYIADECNRRVRMASPTGIITTFGGTGVNEFSGSGGAATSADIAQSAPVYIDIVDINGNILDKYSYNNQQKTIMDISLVPKGTYVLQITQDNNFYTKKVTVK